MGRAWVAQHHFRAAEGGLPSPLVFLAHAAARTSRIRLGTGIITLPLEDPVRVAEDAVVVSLMKGLERGTDARPSQVCTEELGLTPDRFAVVSGPNLALEIARGEPTATVVASGSSATATSSNAVCGCSTYTPRLRLSGAVRPERRVPIPATPAGSDPSL